MSLVAVALDHSTGHMYFAGAILAIAALACSSTAQNASIALPQGTGPYRSTLEIFELVDESRLDPFNSSHLRRIMISRFDPIPAKRCKLTQVPYFTPVTAAVENEILGSYEFPKILDQFLLKVCEKKHHGGHKTRGYGNEFPIALFSPPLNTTRLFGSSIAQEIASHGFITITIDHPYDVDVVEFPNGDVILGGHVIKPADANGSTASVEHALEVRAQDASFVLDTLGIQEDEKVVMFGQSFGGAAVATSMLHDKRIRGGTNVDGMMFGPVLNTSLGTPERPQSFILWGSDGHNTTTDATWGQFWATLKSSPYVDYAKEMSIVNSTHGSYWDLSVLVDAAGIRDELSETAQLLISPLQGERVSKILGKYLSSFFWHALGMKPEDEVFKGPSKEFPEVQILRA